MIKTRAEILKELRRADLCGPINGIDGAILDLAENYGIYPDKYMDKTITTNTLTLSGYDKAADLILALIGDLGFTTDKAFDKRELRRKIVWTIIENTTKLPRHLVYSEPIPNETTEEQEPTDEEINELLADMAKEDEQEQGNFYNTCPHCGQLVR